MEQQQTAGKVCFSKGHQLLISLFLFFLVFFNFFFFCSLLGFSDTDIKKLNNPASTTDLMIVFGDDNVDPKFRTMYVRLVDQDFDGAGRYTDEPRPRPW